MVEALVMSESAERKSMTLEEAKKAKADAEDAVSLALSKFHKATGLVVERIDLRHIDYQGLGIGAGVSLVSAVRLDVRL